MARRLGVGDILGDRYEVLEEIGQGGMGTVLKAHDTSGEREVALKYCHLRESLHLRRFRREVRIMQGISHPNVVPILDAGLDGEPPYFVMPFADHTVRSILAVLKADEMKALSIFTEICKGLQAMHGAGAVHRDLKPDNVLVFGEAIKVSDLGLAKQEERETTILTETIAVIGTQMYLAPEQRMPGGSRDADHRTDIYQLGKTLYEMLTGSYPGLMDLGSVPPGLTHIIRKATENHPDNRYQSVGELLDAVLSYQRSRDPRANPLAAFETLIDRIKSGLQSEEYVPEHIRNLLAILIHEDITRDEEQFLGLFDQLPVALLPLLVEEFESEFTPVLRVYISAIDEVVGDMLFSYAERVADKMIAVLRATSGSPVVRRLALEATLLAAVRLNRFAAMDTFNTMIRFVKEDNDAFEVSEMLRERGREYRTLCNQVPALQLHPQIRQIQAELAQPKEL